MPPHAGWLQIALVVAGLSCGCSSVHERTSAPAAPPSEPAPVVTEPAAVETPAPVTPGETLLDLSYGPHPLNKLDVYVPARPGPHPMLVFVHGGEFFEGDKSAHVAKGKAFAEAGYVFASINHRLSPEVSHPAHVEDVARAVRFLRDEASRLHGDPRRIFLCGHSSGAHLAALVGTDARYLEAERMHPAELGGVILLDGAGYDIGLRLRTAGKRTRQLYTQAFGSDAAGWRAASPPVQVEKGEALPPFLVLYAGKMPTPKAQAQHLARVLRGSGAQATLLHIPERNHVTLEKRLGERGDRATQHIQSFVERGDVTGQRQGHHRAAMPRP